MPPLKYSELPGYSDSNVARRPQLQLSAVEMVLPECHIKRFISLLITLSFKVMSLKCYTGISWFIQRAEFLVLVFEISCYGYHGSIIGSIGKWRNIDVPV